MMWDLISAHRRLTDYLSSRGVESPRAVSEILISHALGIHRIDIYSDFDKPVPEEKLKELNPLVKQVEQGMPLQLIVGNTQFLSHIVRVESGVFIPRPETEGLVDSAARLLCPPGAPDTGPKEIEILDIGTGTGVIALSLLKLLACARAAATDINPAATALAKKNAEILGIAGRFIALEGSLYEPVSGRKNSFNLVISNPPYIPADDIMKLEPAVRDYDPREALDGGPDGLDAVREIIAGAPEYLVAGGLLGLEVGAGQAPAAAELASGAGLNNITIEKDLSGIQRCVFAWKK